VKILNTIKPLFFIKVFCISLPLGLLHKSVAIKSAKIANNRKIVYDSQREKTEKDSMEQGQNLEEK